MNISDTLFSWMQIAFRRNNFELRKELCVLRDMLDGILDEWPEYACKHLPAIIAELDRMNQEDENVQAIKRALMDKAEAMGWQTCLG